MKKLLIILRFLLVNHVKKKEIRVHIAMLIANYIVRRASLVDPK